MANPGGILYLDLSETREGTRMPQEILQHSRAVKVIGLEMHTGADFMITPDAVTSTLMQDIIKAPKMLVRRITEQSYLFQRKTGMDALSSIPNYKSILQRMRDASPHQPWLVVVGEFARCSRGTAVTYNGQTRECDWKFNAFMGALDSWQDFGGCVRMCRDDAELVQFVEARLSAERLAKLAAGKQLVGPQAAIGLVEFEQAAVLMGFPHIGETLAQRIMHYAGGNLAQALTYVAAMPGVPVELEGVGIKTRSDWREYLGLREDEHFVLEGNNEWHPKTKEQDLNLAPLTPDQLQQAMGFDLSPASSS